MSPFKAIKVIGVRGNHLGPAVTAEHLRDFVKKQEAGKQEGGEEGEPASHPVSYTPSGSAAERSRTHVGHSVLVVLDCL